MPQQNNSPPNTNTQTALLHPTPQPSSPFFQSYHHPSPPINLHPSQTMLPDPSLLERVFSVLKHNWVYNFFFSSQPDELEQLRHAVTKSSVTTAEFNLKTLSPFNQTFQVNEHHRILVIPSFCTSNITVGFAVCEKIASSSHVVSRDVYIGRIARDDQNGTCLFIAQDFNDHITEVTYFSLHSPSHRDHIFSLYRTKPFTRVMTSLPRHYNPAALLPALIYHYCATDARPCPHCGTSLANSLLPCPCKLPIRPKRHPDDTERDMINLRSYMGGYHGVATVGLYSRGKTLFHANYAATSGSRLTIDPESHRRLVLWALCSTTRKRPINPLAFCMAKGLLGTKGISATDTFLLASIADSVVDDPQHPNNSSSHSTTRSRTTSSTLALPDISDLDNSNPDDSSSDRPPDQRPSHARPTDSMSLISKPRSIFSTPSFSDSSSPPSKPHSSNTSLVDDAHPLARLLHKVPPMCPIDATACPIAPPFCPIVAPVLVPPVHPATSASHQDPSSATDHPQQSHSTNQQTTAPTSEAPPLQPASTTSAPSSTPQDTSSPQATLPQPAPLQSSAASQGLSHSRGASESHRPQLPPLKPRCPPPAPAKPSIPTPPEAPPARQDDPLPSNSTSQCTVAPKPAVHRPVTTLAPFITPPIHTAADSRLPPQTLQPPIPLHAPTRLHHKSLPAHPSPAAPVAYQGQVTLAAASPAANPSMVPRRAVPLGAPMNPQAISSHAASLHARPSSSLQPHHVIAMPPQGRPLVAHQGMRPLAPQQATAMPLQTHGTLPSHQPARLQPQPVPPLQAQPSAPYQRGQGSVSQTLSGMSRPLSGMSYPSTLQTTGDMRGSSVHSMSERRGSSSCYSDGRGGSEASLEKVRPLRPAPLQPRYILPMQTAESGTVGGRVSKTVGDELDERRRKAELRKARNRESAQRSNHRRKMRIQALKDDIAAAAKREMILRAKEKMLREENSTLRRTVRNDC